MWGERRQGDTANGDGDGGGDKRGAPEGDTSREREREREGERVGGRERETTTTRDENDATTLRRGRDCEKAEEEKQTAMSDVGEQLLVYVSSLCPLVLDFAGDAAHAREFERALQPGTPALDVLDQFAKEATAALFIEYTPSGREAQGGGDGEAKAYSSRFRVGLEPTAVLGSSSASVALVKSVSAALRDDVSVAAQLRVITLARTCAWKPQVPA